jgi:IS4 transposase
VSAARLRLADWTILLTNVPPELPSVEEALVLARCRWQIELLWKLWKQHGKIDTWCSEKPYRILTEIYAKLLRNPKLVRT